MHDPFDELLARPDGALALLIDSQGGFPRRAGAAMALWPDGDRVGRLGAGCIDEDIAFQLDRPGTVSRLIYGKGGPVDLPLPCGGSVEIALLRNPDPAWLNAVAATSRERMPACWKIDLGNGDVSRSDAARTGLSGDMFYLNMNPPLALHIHGEGDEQRALSAMAQALGIPNYTGSDAPPADFQTAVVTLFHDHDRELPALRMALDSPAFYVGALGSRRAQMARLAALREAGLDDAALARLHGPIGVLSPVREPRLLAASVLTEILAEYDRIFG